MKKKSRNKKWSLNPQEVSLGWTGSSRGKSGIFKRNLKITSRSVTLIHEPTGIEVEGKIPEGHYSKKEMRKKTKELEEILFSELELKVAKKLEIRGM